MAAGVGVSRGARADPPTPAGRPGRRFGCPGGLLERSRGRVAAGRRIGGAVGGEALRVGGAGPAAQRTRAGSVLAPVGSGGGRGGLGPAGGGAAAGRQRALGTGTQLFRPAADAGGGQSADVLL